MSVALKQEIAALRLFAFPYLDGKIERIMLISGLILLLWGTMAMGFSSATNWDAGDEWRVVGPDSLSVSATSETFAWNQIIKPESTWTVSATIRILRSKGAVGSARLVFGNSAHKEQLIISVERHTSGLSLACVDVRNGEMKRTLTSNWLPGADTIYTIQAVKANDILKIGLRGDRGLRYYGSAPPIPKQVLDSLTAFGVGSYATDIEFSNIRFVNEALDIGGDKDIKKVPPAKLPNGRGHYTAQAKAAMSDLVRNFWKGSQTEGNVIPTYNGYTSDVLPMPRGGIWERGMMIFCMDALYRATGDPVLRQRMLSEWQRMKRVYTVQELEAAGSSVHPACDDSGWDAMLYMIFYRHLGDRFALDRAKGLIDNSYKRWLDDDMGGGMWYDNEHSCKSLYQTGIVLPSLQIWEVTKDKSFRDRAVSCYEWMESHLLRSDGLYWCDLTSDGPAGKERPDSIHEAGSVVFLGGNMAMGVIHAWMYRDTGDKKYLDRAIRTAEAISKKITKGGIYFSDRDAWVNGSFADEWAESVLTLPGIDKKHKDLLLHTADSIYKYDRTPDGYYGGCWGGPADGACSPWSAIGSRAQQIMTSASTANVIMAAALFESIESGRRSNK